MLELGSGAGNNLRFLAEEGFQAVGAEYSSSAVRYARRRMQHLELPAGLVQADCRHLPFKPESFDLVLDRACLVHFPYEQGGSIIQSCHRLLREGGALISLGFKSSRHPQADHGTRLDRWSRSHLTEGPLAVADVTCFLNSCALEHVFSAFRSLDWRMHTTTDRNGTIIDEQYLVEACRD